MTLLETLAILEAAVLECKKRDVDTPEVRVIKKVSRSEILSSDSAMRSV